MVKNQEIQNTSIDTLPQTALTLHRLIGVFKGCAKECANAFLSKQCECPEDWEVVDRLNGSADYILIVGCGSKDYRALISLGINREAVKTFIDDDVGADEIRDIFGEFANTYSGMLMDDITFSSTFGILNQSVPVLYSEGTPFLPFISGIEGKIYIEDKWIYLGFAIQRINERRK